MSMLARALAAPVLARDRMRPDVGPLLVIAVLVGVTAFVAAALPRVLAASADAGLRAAIAAAPPAARNLEFERQGSIAPASDDPLALVDAAGADLRQGLPPRVGALVAGTGIVVDSVEHLVVDAPQPITQARFRVQPGIEQLIAYVEGRPPTGEVRQEVLADRRDASDVPYTANVYEAAISTATAASLQVKVGDRLLVQPQPDGPLVQRIGSRNLGYDVVNIVGRFDVRDPSDPAWFEDVALHDAGVEVLGFDIYVHHATLLVAPGSYPALVSPQPGSSTVHPTFPLRYRWRMAIDPGRVDAGASDALVTDVARLRSEHTAADAETATLRTSLDTVLHGYASQRARTESALTVAAVGPAIAAAGALALVALLLVRRRIAATAVVRSRGASTAQVLGARTIEAVAVVVPAAAAGLILAVAVVPARSTVETLAAAAVGATGVGLLAAAAWPGARAGGGVRSVERVTLRPPARRIVADGLVVTVAVGATGALLGRGLRPEAAGVDPLLAAAPALLALAVGLLAVRLLPVPVAIVAAAVARRRDLLPVLAARSAARHPAASAIPLLVVIVATAMAVFSSVAGASVDAGQDRATWQEVGADLRLSVAPGRSVPEPVRDAAVPGVRATAEARVQAANVRGSGVRPFRATLLLLDVAAHRALTTGTPIARSDDALAPIAGTAADRGPGEPIPVLVAPGVLTRTGVAVGTDLENDLAPGTPFRIVGSIASVPGFTLDDRSIVAPLEALRAVVGADAALPTHLLVAAEDPASSEVEVAYRDLVAPYSNIVGMDARGQWVRALRGSPLVEALRAGFVLAMGVAFAYAALALAAGTILVAGARAKEHAILRTLGVTGRGVASLVLLEQLPLVAVALVAGIGLGLGMAALLVPALGLDVFTGSAGTGLPGSLAAVPVTIVVDAPRTLAFAVVPMVAVVGVVVGVVWLLGRRNLARSVRVGEA